MWKALFGPPATPQKVQQALDASELSSDLAVRLDATEEELTCADRPEPKSMPPDSKENQATSSSTPPPPPEPHTRHKLPTDPTLESTDPAFKMMMEMKAYSSMFDAVQASNRTQCYLTAASRFFQSVVENSNLVRTNAEDDDARLSDAERKRIEQSVKLVELARRHLRALLLLYMTRQQKRHLALVNEAFELEALVLVVGTSNGVKPYDMLYRWTMRVDRELVQPGSLKVERNK